MRSASGAQAGAQPVTPHRHPIRIDEGAPAKGPNTGQANFIQMRWSRGGMCLLLGLVLLVPSLPTALPTTAFHDPTFEGSASSYALHPPIAIYGNAGFTPGNGVTSGTGTPSDPYILEGWEIDASTGNGIEILGTTAHFVIRNVSVHSGGIGHIGIVLSDVENGTVENALVRTSIVGIAVSGRDIVVRNNTVEDNDWGIQISGDARTVEVFANHVVRGGRGIVLAGSRFARVHGNMVERTQWGALFAFGGAANSTIDGNLVLRAGVGVELGDVLLGAASDLVIERNEIIQGGYGILAFSSPRMTIRNNTIHGSGTGINYHDSTDLVIRDNSIAYSNGEAVYLEGIQRFTLEANSFLSNLFGTYLYLSGDARIVGNNFLFNRYPFGLTNPFNVSWADPYPEGGNFWSEYRGADVCRGPTQSDCSGGDGIGDTPFTANLATTDPRPLMTPTLAAIRYPLWGSAGDGWGLHPDDTSTPGPTLLAAAGTWMSVTLRGNDTLVHSWFVDYDNDSLRDSAEPSSPDFQGPGPVTFDFFVDRIGNYTYRCRFHPFTMAGVLEIRPSSLGPDMPPVPAFIVTPSTGNRTTTFLVDATATSDAHDPAFALQVRWDWEGDGVFDTEWNATRVAQHVYGEGGVFAITLEVVDTSRFTARASHLVTVDVDPPLTTIDLGGILGSNGWHRSRVIVSFLATDDASGVTSTQYRLDGDGWQEVLGPIDVGDGVHVIDYFSIDAVGNMEPTQTLSFRVDANPPAFESFGPSGTVTRSSVVVSWSASDSTSGIDRYEVSVDGGPFESLGTLTNLTEVFADGAHTIHVKAIDRAGHNATVGISFAVDTNVFSFTGPYSGAPTLALVAAVLIAVLAVWWRWRKRRGPSVPPNP